MNRAPEAVAYLGNIAERLRIVYGADWKRYTTAEAIKKHEDEGWEWEKFVDYIAMKFNLKPLAGMV